MARFIKMQVNCNGCKRWTKWRAFHEVVQKFLCRRCFKTADEFPHLFMKPKKEKA